MSNHSGCLHHGAVKKKYVGRQETYWFCPEPACLMTWEGEEGPAKDKLIQAACLAGVTEEDEVNGVV